MNRELVEAWVAALRSGEYQQGKGWLRRANGTYCCLGVAYDVLVRRGEGAWSEGDEGFAAADTGDAVFLPMNAAFKFGIASQFALSGFNDHEGYTFPMIADWIDAHILGEAEA